MRTPVYTLAGCYGHFDLHVVPLGIQDASKPFTCVHKLVDFSVSMQAGVAVLPCP